MTSLAETSLKQFRVLTFRGILRSEWSKLFSLRAPWWIALAMVILPIALGMIRAAATSPPAPGGSPVLGTAAALESVAIGVIPIGFLAAVLGLVAMSAEYVEDALSVTFSVAPRRRLVLAAKALPVIATAGAAAVLGLTGAALAAWLLLTARGYTDLPVAEIIVTVLLGSIGAALLGVVGLGCTAIHRTALGASLHLGVLLALAPTAIASILGTDAHLITDLLPGTALQAIATEAPGLPFTIEGAPASTLSRPEGMIVLACWAFGYLAVALTVIRRRSISPLQRRSRSRRTALTLAEGQARPRLTIVGVFRSEVLKFLTLPATWWLIGTSGLATIGLALLQADRTRPADLFSGPITAHDLVTASVSQQTQVIAAGIGITPILLAFVGALAFTSEFSSGNIRPTLIAVPRRRLVFGVKVVVVVGVIAVSTSVATVLAAVLTHPIEQQMGLVVTLQNSAVTEAILRCVLVSILIGLLGCAIGVVLRSAISAIGALVGILIVTHTALGPMQSATKGTPLIWLANLHELFPSPARAVVTLRGDYFWPQFLDGDVLQLDPDQSLLVVTVWAVTALTVGYFTFRRRAV